MATDNHITHAQTPVSAERRAAWIEAMRPRTLPLAAAGSFIAAAIAARYGVFRWGVFVLMLITSVLLQIIANFADDYGDLKSGLDDDSRVGPKRGLQRGIITFAQMRHALMGTCILTLLCGITLVVVAFSAGPDISSTSIAAMIAFVILGIASIAAALLYTMGSHPYGYIGLGDIMSFVFFGIVAVVGGSFLYLHAFITVAWVAALALGCPVMAVMNVNNMRDARADAAKGKRTVANMLGDPAMRAYGTGLLVAGAILFVVSAAMASTRNPISYVLMLASYAPWVKVDSGFWRISDPEKFDVLMAPTSMGTVLVALVWTIVIAFVR